MGNSRYLFIVLIAFHCVFASASAIAQENVKSFPDFGNKFARTRSLYQLDRGRSYLQIDSNQLYLVFQDNSSISSNLKYVREHGTEKATCIDCDDYISIDIPQNFTIPKFDYEILYPDSANVPPVLHNIFRINNSKLDSRFLRVAIGEDNSLIGLGMVDGPTQYFTEDGRCIDFVNINLSKMISEFLKELVLFNDFNANDPSNWEIIGRYIQKKSEKEFQFEWVLKYPNKWSKEYGKVGIREFYLITTLNENFDFTIEGQIKIENENKYLKNLGMTDDKGSRYYFRQISIPEVKSKLDFIKEGQSSDANQSDESDVGDELLDPRQNQPVVKYVKRIEVSKLFSNGDSLLLISDTLSIKYNPLNELFFLVFPDSLKNSYNYFKVKANLIEVNDSIKLQALQKLKGLDVDQNAWVDWSFLGFSETSSFDENTNGSNGQFQSIESMIEIIRYRPSGSDTIIFKGYNNSFLEDVCISKDGVLHVLVRSKFSESKFGSKVHIVERSKEFGLAYYNGGLDTKSLNEDLISYLSYFEVPINGDLVKNTFDNSTRCDISEMDSGKKHFRAIFKRDDVELGGIEVGIYSSSELKSGALSNKKRKKGIVYILISGDVYKYHSKEKVFWIGDGTRLENVENSIAAIDLAIRCYMRLHLNVQLNTPICYE